MIRHGWYMTIKGIPKMYDPAANVIWNGNAIKGLPAIDAFVRAMPLSRHDVQCVDCHPVDGEWSGSVECSVSGEEDFIGTALRASSSAEKLLRTTFIAAGLYCFIGRPERAW
jgi:hypothetical protein